MSSFRIKIKKPIASVPTSGLTQVSPAVLVPLSKVINWLLDVMFRPEASLNEKAPEVGFSDILPKLVATPTKPLSFMTRNAAVGEFGATNKEDKADAGVCS